jgi:hypothetical protein
MKAKLTNLMELYGRLAVGIYVAICVLSFGACYVLLSAGLHNMLPAALLEHLPTEGTAAVGAYALYKALMPPRIAAALLVTPIIGRWLGRVPAAQREAA